MACCGSLQTFTATTRGPIGGIGKGQFYNLGMALGGLLILLILMRRPAVVTAPVPPRPEPSFAALLPWRFLFILVLCFSLLARSGWNQDVIKSIRGAAAAADEACIVCRTRAARDVASCRA
jgi:cellobiose-specific phosphotransferase system component IIC